MSILVQFFAFFIALPFLAFIAVYYLSAYITKEKKDALLHAIYVTTVCLVLTVTVMLQVIMEFNYGFVLIVIVTVFLFLGLYALQKSVKGQTDIDRIIRGSIIILFIILTTVYIVLFVSSIIKSL